MLHNYFTVAASDIFYFELNFISNFFNRKAISFVQSELLIIRNVVVHNVYLHNILYALIKK